MRQYFLYKNGEPFIDGTLSNKLRLTFTIEVLPNDSLALCELGIYNIKDGSAIKFGDTIELHAGYDTAIGVIFKGTVINVFKDRDGPDIYYRVICRTLTIQNRGALSVSYGQDTSIIDALKDIAKAWPLVLDIVEEDFSNAIPFTSGRSLSGDLPTALNTLKREYEFEWVEHAGRLIITKPSDVREDVTAIEVSQHTGMEGIPEVNKGPNAIGVTVNKRLDPFIFINSVIEVKTGFTSFNTGNVFFGAVPPDTTANGKYTVFSLVYRGDSHGQEWTTEITALRNIGQYGAYGYGVGSGVAYDADQIPDGQVVFGKKVTAEFKAKVFEICDKLRMDPNYLMAVMGFETIYTFRTDIANPKSSARGLIQFTDITTPELGKTPTQLANMDALEQLDYVYKYLKKFTGRMKTIEDAYMAVLWPTAIGSPNSYVLWRIGSDYYRDNQSLDVNHNGEITKGEAGFRVRQALNIGMKEIG